MVDSKLNISRKFYPLMRLFLVGACGAAAIFLAIAAGHAEAPLPPVSIDAIPADISAPKVSPAPVPVLPATSAAHPSYDGTRPDPTKTPGAVRTTDRNEICTRKTKEIRNVSGALKEAIRREYGLAHKRDKWCNNEEGCEIDHLIPLLAGGSNDPSNLFPQTYDRSVTWNAHVKDRLEMKLKKLICKQNADIPVLQAEVARDWIAAYLKYVGKEPIVAESRDAGE